MCPYFNKNKEREPRLKGEGIIPIEIFRQYKKGEFW